MSSPAPVMADVARLAGVSLQTVSRVVNDSPNVSGATRARVLAAMDHLDYRRNSVARALATRRSSVIGVIIVDVVLHGPIRILYAIEQAARRRGIGVTIVVVEAIGTDAIKQAVRRLQDQSVEGVIALAPHEETIPVLTESLSAFPAVLVGGVLGGPSDGGAATLPTVGINHHGGAVAATRHLLDLGHRTVHHLAGPPNWLSARWRVEGWRSVLAGAGAPHPPLRRGDWSARSGHAAMTALLADDPALTAVFVANDQMALGALSSLAAAGRRVPGDVSVVGFDDLPEAAFYQPSLTTVRQRFHDAGERAVRLLLDTIRPEDAPAARHAAELVAAELVAAELVAAELVVRASTGPPP